MAEPGPAGPAGGGGVIRGQGYLQSRSQQPGELPIFLVPLEQEVALSLKEGMTEVEARSHSAGRQGGGRLEQRS